MHKPGGVLQIGATAFERIGTAACQPGVLVGQHRLNHEHLATRFALAAAAACCSRCSKRCARRGDLAKTLLYIVAARVSAPFLSQTAKAPNFPKLGVNMSSQSAHSSAAVRAGLDSSALWSSQRSGAKACKDVSALIHASIARLARTTCWRLGRPPARCARGYTFPTRHPPRLVQRMVQLPIFVPIRKLTPLLCKIQTLLATPGQTAQHATSQALFQVRPPTEAADSALRDQGSFSVPGDLVSIAQNRGEQQHQPFCREPGQRWDVRTRELSRTGLALLARTRSNQSASVLKAC